MIKALIVEDDPAIADMYQMKCELSGINVEIAKNGLEGILLLKTFTPDAILLDLVMPEMNGVEFMHFLRQNPLYVKTPVIVLTNTAAEEVPQGLWGMNIADFIIKAECTPSEVIQKIKSVVKESQSASTA